MRVVRTLLVVCLMSLAISVAGCQAVEDKIAEETSEKLVEGATGVDVETSEDEVTITGEDGKSITSSQSGELPEDFPTDVPVYEGDIESSLFTEGNFTVAIKTADSAEDVYAWCLDEVKAGGWEVKSEFKAEGGGMIAAEKDGNMVQYTLSSTDEGTDLLVYTGPIPK